MKEKKIRKLLKSEENWLRFLDWMRGQTVSTYPNGEIDYYDHDVQSFIDKLEIGYDRQKTEAWD